ncbi:sensor histidine kinase [Paenibacillus harenae]|uniref:sensor histidine kinase n=1 Tax=Paenibacillus harenae TaxID=306543 RepID=UPI0004050BB2|nr:sensor histidine kinase [Paenibacillus harenae]
MLKLIKKNVLEGSFRKKLLISYLLILLTLVVSALLILGLNTYNQAKSYYEDFMIQESVQTDVIIQDYLSNIARYSYFYATDNKLTNILEMRQMTTLDYLAASHALETAMDQFILLNGHIAGLAIVGSSGHIYNSSGANMTNLKSILSDIPQEEWLKGKIWVSAPYDSAVNFNRDKLVSIVRYLSDIEPNRDSFAYVKMDIRFKPLNNILGGISESDSELGTIIIADGRAIYNSYEHTFGQAALSSITSTFERENSVENKLIELKLQDKNYLFISKKNALTNWTIIQFMPTSSITERFKRGLGSYSLISLFSLVIAFFIATMFAKYFFKPIHKLTSAMKLVDTGNLDFRLEGSDRNDEIGQLVRSYNAMILRLKDSRKMENLSYRLQKKAELKMMQAQINPHFLYNTLNTIHAIAGLHRIDPISEMTKSLSSMYQYNIKSSDIVMLHQELEQIKNYINIQQIRFLDKFQVIYDIPDELSGFPILKFLIQPIVENAFYHGLEPKGDKGTIKITAKKNGNILIIRVKDDGVGISEQKLKELNESFQQFNKIEESEMKAHFGLINVYARIKYYYGDHYWMSIESVRNEYTCVEMIIPVELEA